MASRGKNKKTAPGPRKGPAAAARYGERAVALAQLEAWPNPQSGRPYLIELTAPEFTCLCPRSGFPDFATFSIAYVPARKVVELKSLKLYLNAYRDRPISHEGAVNAVLSDLVKLLRPLWMEVVGDFGVRGNIKTLVTARHGRRPPGV